jgi:plasmid stabilization system protein ParE
MKIQWTKAAKEKYVEIIDFLEDNWGESVVKSFSKKIRKSLNTIIKNPKAAPISNKHQSIHFFSPAKISSAISVLRPVLCFVVLFSFPFFAIENI